MIEDILGDIQGCLIDWEFAIHMSGDEDGTPAVGGTGTLPFMSRRLLGQMSPNTWPTPRAYKTASSTAPPQFPAITQDYSDDLESALYVFLWICFNYSGPLGLERNRLETPLMTDPWCDPDVMKCVGAKYLLFNSQSLRTRFLDQIDPYFKDLTSLAADWLDVMAHNDSEVDSPVSFDAVLNVLDSFLSGYSVDEASPERYIAMQELKIPPGQGVMKRKRLRIVPESEGGYLSKKRAKAI
jgi:hypothetical protein